MAWDMKPLIGASGQIAFAPVFELTAVTCELDDHAVRGLGQFTESFAREHGGGLTWYQVGEMKRPRRVDSRATSILSHWFSHPSNLSAPIMGYEAFSGPTARPRIPPGLDLALFPGGRPPVLSVQVLLPVEMVLADPERIVAFAQTALSTFPLHAGYAGLAIHAAGDPYQGDYSALWPVLVRHPGLSYGDHAVFSSAVPEGVVAVNWLTFIGSKYVGALGGLDGLSRSTGAGIELAPLGEGGALLRAGDVPVVGDINRGDWPDAYARVGRLLAPVRISDETFAQLPFWGFDEEAQLAWLTRFFR